MSTTTIQGDFDFDFMGHQVRPTSKQSQCRHIWRSVTLYHPDYSNISVDEIYCKRCGLNKDW